MRQATSRTGITGSVVGTATVALGLLLLAGAPLANAMPTRQLTTTELRPLVLTTAQAMSATGFEGTLIQFKPRGFRCGYQEQTKAPYCSRIWSSPGDVAHPSITTVAAYGTPQQARAQIASEAARAGQAGTVLESSPTLLVYVVTIEGEVGNAAIAQRAVGSLYAYAWCGSAASEPTEPAVQCARDLLGAQVAKARSG